MQGQGSALNPPGGKALALLSPVRYGLLWIGSTQ